MKKQQVLAEIRVAKSSLVEWKPYIQAYTLGLPVDARHLPQISTDSTYGKWYINEGTELSSISPYSEINSHLQECFSRFQLLHQEVHTPAKGGLFTSKDKAEADHKARMEELSNNLYTSINNLIHITNRLEHKVQEFTEEELEAML